MSVKKRGAPSGWIGDTILFISRSAQISLSRSTLSQLPFSRTIVRSKVAKINRTAELRDAPKIQPLFSDSGKFLPLTPSQVSKWKNTGWRGSLGYAPGKMGYAPNMPIPIKKFRIDTKRKAGRTLVSNSSTQPKETDKPQTIIDKYSQNMRSMRRAYARWFEENLRQKANEKEALKKYHKTRRETRQKFEPSHIELMTTPNTINEPFLGSKVEFLTRVQERGNIWRPSQNPKHLALQRKKSNTLISQYLHLYHLSEDFITNKEDLNKAIDHAFSNSDPLTPFIESLADLRQSVTDPIMTSSYMGKKKAEMEQEVIDAMEGTLEGGEVGWSGIREVLQNERDEIERESLKRRRREIERILSIREGQKEIVESGWLDIPHPKKVKVLRIEAEQKDYSLPSSLVNLDIVTLHAPSTDMRISLLSELNYVNKALSSAPSEADIHHQRRAELDRLKREYQIRNEDETQYRQALIAHKMSTTLLKAQRHDRADNLSPATKSKIAKIVRSNFDEAKGVDLDLTFGQAHKFSERYRYMSPRSENYATKLEHERMEQDRFEKYDSNDTQDLNWSYRKGVSQSEDVGQEQELDEFKELKIIQPRGLAGRLAEELEGSSPLQELAEEKELQNGTVRMSRPHWETLNDAEQPAEIEREEQERPLEPEGNQHASSKRDVAKEGTEDEVVDFK